MAENRSFTVCKDIKKPELKVYSLLTLAFITN